MNYDMYRRSESPDYDELKERYEALKAEKADEDATLRKKTISGVGLLLKQLRGEAPKPKPQNPPRMVVGPGGGLISGGAAAPNGVSHNHYPSKAAPSGPITFQPAQVSDALTHAVARPSNPAEIRRLVRQKMVRCKKCKSRFLEKNLYERHLRDFHQVEYVAYLIQQEEEMQIMRAEEIEANRIEEITSGGFIPPENDVEAGRFSLEISTIPLPGELTNGVAPRFDKFGVLHQPKRQFKKKVSPQCPFCDKRFRNEHSLKKHIEKKHTECAEFVQCLVCFKCVPSKEELPTHRCDMTYMCFECTPARNLCTEVRLTNHRAKFHRGAMSGFKCHVCNQKFLTPRKLRKHKKMSHVFTKTYPCHFCDELFTSETMVTTHERIHTGIIKFECKICDFKCNRYKSMEEHRKDEHGYICAICNGKQAEWSDLKNHTLNDHGGYLSAETNSGYVVSPRVWVMYKGD